MRVSPGIVTFILGLAILAVAGVFYQQSLIKSGAYGNPDTMASEASQPQVKYMCPMRCVETDEPGSCTVCGMVMTAVEVAPAVASSSPAAITEYTCPMHPQIVQDHEGTCPICGMELVPKVGNDSEVSNEVQESVAAVKLSPLQAVLSDITPVHATTQSLDVTVPAIGEVTIPQNQVNKLVSWQPGRIDNLILRDTGGEVKEGDHLLDIYSEDLIQAQEEYLLALQAVEQLGDSGYSSIAGSSQRLMEASRQKLLRLGMSAKQVAKLETERKVQEHLPIYASHGGTVMDKMVEEGMYLDKGSNMFTVAKLDPVWVEVEIFERDFAMIKMGDRVSMKCPIHPGMVFSGTIALIEPSLDPASRTHQARVVVDNPSSILKPGMIMDAELTVSHGDMLLLPRNAVLHTGDGDLVYVLTGENQWEPRRIVTGADFGEYVEVLSGITQDEAVAGTAVFMLDSEAQLKGVPRPVDGNAQEEPAPGGDAHGGHSN